MDNYAEKMEQISLYEVDITYGELFEGQNVKLWPIDEPIISMGVSTISISDFNDAMIMQGKDPIILGEDEYLINCNYKGTFNYIENFLKTNPLINVGGISLKRASNIVLKETYCMTSIGNNDRGTFIVPDLVADKLLKDCNALLAQYKEGVDSDEVLQKMIPIGLDDTNGCGYTEKNMMYEMFYGVNALVSFLCCYIGLVFLLICAALLALKQLTETTDNIFRYGLLQKIGANTKQINRTLFVQIAVFFAVPLVVAGIYSIVFINKAMEIVEDFMNIHISTNVIFTVVLFLLVYGSYFFATYMICKRMVEERQ